MDFLLVRMIEICNFLLKVLLNKIRVCIFWKLGNYESNVIGVIIINLKYKL